VSGGKRGSGGAKKACCMVSEILEEAGIDRARVRKLRRQVLEGVILMCQWQLQRMQEEPRAGEASGDEEPGVARGRRGRRIAVE
jgi:hypothetical protein